MTALAALLPDGRRLHLQHGPIDLIVEAWGAEAERRRALEQAARRFDGLLEALVEELPALRRPPRAGALRGAVARRMEAAALPHAGVFLTPMAAVAGAVADEILHAMTAGRRLSRASVNNGGDAAFFLAPGEAMRIAIAGRGGAARIGAEDAPRGVATSGWRGRSFSLGIADAVTVLAPTAAAADAAATLIANAVDLPGHAAVRRAPARELDPDSDLGPRLVTVDVGPLTPDEIETALAAGLACAEGMRGRGLIDDAALFLAGRAVATGPLLALEPAHA